MGRSPPTIAMNTITLAPRITCVREMLDSRLTHGAAMTGCTASSPSSPRCAASCRTHHWQIFFPNVSAGSCRPHRMQFAMSNKRVSALENILGRQWLRAGSAKSLGGRSADGGKASPQQG